MHIYQETVDFLTSRYPDKTQVVGFSSEDTRLLYERFGDRGAAEETQTVRTQIRQAFGDYLQDVGRCVVLFRGQETIGVRLSAPDRISPSAPAFKNAIRLLQEAENTIYSASGREDLLVVDEALLAQLHSALAAHPGAINRRDALRRAVRSAFSLQPQDAVVFLGGRLYVRLFSVQGASGSRVERRYGGLPPEELERLKQDLFKESVDAAMIEVAASLCKSALDFTRIDNTFYEQNALKLIQGAIARYLHSKLRHEKAVLDAFSAYLLRENFLLIHRVLAESLLEAVMQGAENAERFLKYYTGEVAMLEGQKYQLPEIVDSQGMRWNFSVIKAITTQYARELHQSEGRQEQLDQLSADEQALEQAIIEAKQALKQALKEQTAAHVALKESGDRLTQLRQELQSARKEAARKGALEEESETIATLSSRIREQTAEDEACFKARSKADRHLKSCSSALEALERRRHNIQRKATDEQARLEQHAMGQEELTGRFELLCEALAIALTKRKQKL